MEIKVCGLPSVNLLYTAGWILTKLFYVNSKNFRNFRMDFRANYT